MRPARATDADDLLAWRNDPVTLACSRSTAEVSREDHDRWMQFNVEQGYPQHLVMIADGGSDSLGVVRFDAMRDLMSYTVSITVAPQHRGKGLANGVLTEACRHMHEYTLHAEVRQENTASRRLFAHCGFRERMAGPDDEFVRYRREPRP